MSGRAIADFIEPWCWLALETAATAACVVFVFMGVVAVYKEVCQ